MNTGVLWVNLREEYHLEDICEDGNIILKWILECCDGRARTGSIMLGFGTGGWILCTQ
jgi:hypothetical protein